MAELNIKRLTIKLGTSVVSGADGQFREEALSEIVAGIAAGRKKGKEVLLVSSGAIGLGRHVLKDKKREDLPFRQASAAIGPSLLMNSYQKLFSRHGLQVAQV